MGLGGKGHGGGGGAVRGLFPSPLVVSLPIASSRTVGQSTHFQYSGRRAVGGLKWRVGRSRGASPPDGRERVTRAPPSTSSCCCCSPSHMLFPIFVGYCTSSTFTHTCPLRGHTVTASISYKWGGICSSVVRGHKFGRLGQTYLQDQSP